MTDLIHFIIFLAYLTIRWDDNESTIPTAEFIGKVRTFEQQLWLTTLNLAIIMTGTIKIMYFIRVYKAIGWIVELVERCLYDVKEFTLFFLAVMGLFGAMFFITGVYPFDGTDPEQYFLFWITVFRDCIGDIQDLEYPFWNAHKVITKTLVVDGREETVSEMQAGPVLMIFFILTIFTVLLFLMIIVLLNFLIAVISQTYENVMTTKTSTTYRHYAELNRECRLNLHSFGLDQSMHPFILSCECS